MNAGEILEIPKKLFPAHTFNFIINIFFDVFLDLHHQIFRFSTVLKHGFKVFAVISLSLLRKHPEDPNLRCVHQTRSKTIRSILVSPDFIASTWGTSHMTRCAK